ncbi:MAG TPA: ABC transporter permease [Bryobacteraceae bacterium]|jgi:putative ABC transport system permease protein
MLGALWRDLRYAVRTLARNPGFTFVAVLALALGMGANTAIFTVVNAVLLQPLRYPKSEQLISVAERNLKAGFPVFSLSPGNYVDFRDHNHSFSGFAAFGGKGLNLSTGSQPERLLGVRVTPEFFDVLATKPQMGRTFTAEEMVPGASHVAILSQSLWRERFAGRPDVLGQTLKLNSEIYTVIGVMPADFQFPRSSQIWIPLDLEASEWQQRGGHYLNGIGRLKDGMTLASAEADLNTIAARAEQQFPASNAGWDTTSMTLQDRIVRQIRTVMWTLSAVVGAVLLIACVNLANLLLSRSAARHREISIRSSLGAGPGRIIRQLLTESVLLASMGAAAGLAIAWGATRLLVYSQPDLLPRSGEIALDGRVLVFTAALAVFTGVLFGLAPALRLAKTNLASAVREGGRGNTIGFRRNRLRSVLVIGEVALALVLLSVAGLAIRSFTHLQAVNPGFDPHQVLTFRIDLPEAQYKTNAQQAAFYRHALERIRALPGVTAAGAGQVFPLSRSNYILDFTQIGKPPVAPGHEPNAGYYAVTPGYLEALRIPVKSGRDFTARDDASAPPVALISESMARKFYPGENPLGQRIQMGNGSKPAEIVGIVGDIRDAELESTGLPAVFEPAEQIPFTTMFFGVRVERDPDSLISSIRSAIREQDPEIPLDAVGTADALVEQALSMDRFSTFLMSAFAVLALLLALVGIYGVLSYAVTQATQEIGIRMALGAQQGHVLKMVLGHAGILMAVGLVIGLAGGLGAGRLLASELYEVKAADPVTFASTALVLLATGLLACAIPALRAARVDPLTALREE